MNLIGCLYFEGTTIRLLYMMFYRLLSPYLSQEDSHQLHTNNVISVKLIAAVTESEIQVLQALHRERSPFSLISRIEGEVRVLIEDLNINKDKNDFRVSLELRRL